MQLADPASAAQPGFAASDSEPPRSRWRPWRPAAKELTRAAVVLGTCLRGLVHRAGSAVIVLVVAVVAAGAAAAGPVLLPGGAALDPDRRARLIRAPRS